MDKEQQEIKIYLEEQVEWCKFQDAILEKIENKLFKMKELAVYATDYNLTLTETEMINAQLNMLKQSIPWKGSYILFTTISRHCS